MHQSQIITNLILNENLKFHYYYVYSYPNSLARSLGILTYCHWLFLHISAHLLRVEASIFLNDVQL